MKIHLLKQMPMRLFAFGMLLFSLNIAVAQTAIKGKIIDAGTGEVLVGATVVVKGTQIGAQTDYDGLFSFTTEAKPPITLQISFIGFESIEQVVTADTKYPLSIKLGNATKTIDVVEITGQRISDKTKAGPLTVESMDRLAIKQTTGVTFYEGLSNLKGVDMTTASMGFSVINTRGFNSTSPVRSLQIIDGVDNQAPGLNFSLGNFLGSSELDVLKVDLVVGASSAYYGPNAFNGVLSMETKNPFFQKGLSAQIKTGERGLTEVAFRYADSKKNKEGLDWMAFKINGFFFKAYDWVADNYDPVYDTKSGKTNPGGYDAINIYGDEYQGGFDRSQTSITGDFVGAGVYHRQGYKEVDMVDYNTRNIKANAAVHFRTNPAMQEQSPELILSSSFGSGTTVYQGDNRFSLKDILFFQNRIEFRKRDKYFIRAYATNEDAGNSYDPYFTALLLQGKSKTNDQYASDYDLYWLNNARTVMNANGFPKATNFYDPVTMQYYLKFDTAAAKTWLASNNDLLTQLHQKASRSAGETNTAFPFFTPGTEAFNTEFKRITSTKSSKRDLKTGGTQFYDKSALYHLHGERKFQPTKGVDEFTIGANLRQYRPLTEGTIFYDTAGTRITNTEFGIYSGLEKKFGKDTEGGMKPFKFNATLRMDKNENFNYLFSPAASLVWQPNKKDFLRVSFSSAIRNPTLSDQYLYLNVGRAILSGNINGVKNLATVESLLDFFNRVSRDTSVIRRFNIDKIRPEQVKSFEIGYRTTLFEKTFIDASYYFSRYKDFIGYQLGVDVYFDKNAFPKDIQAYRYAANSKNVVTTQGFSIGVSHYFAKFYQFSGNYSWNRLNTKLDDPIIPAFNTPEHKFNLGISGRDVEIGKLKNFGFNVNYKWIQGFDYEGSPQFTGNIPSYDLVDAQLNYKFTKINTTVKMGASNALDNRVYQVYGGPRVGRMAYISMLYEFAKK